MANVYDIIIRPIITERSMEATADKKYVFEVAPTAGKIEIKNAVEQIFGVKVAKVNTINYDGKTKRVGAGRPGARKSWKKAYVQLTQDSKTIEFFVLRENTVRPICRWQKIWGIPPFSGVWLM